MTTTETALVTITRAQCRPPCNAVITHRSDRPGAWLHEDPDGWMFCPHKEAGPGDDPQEHLTARELDKALTRVRAQTRIVLVIEGQTRDLVIISATPDAIVLCPAGD